ncbi:MAG: hypothetical protein JWO36_5975 [Myxococcales bacterium]|nr:hypothetical protein [Myxococcales bacterium]
MIRAECVAVLAGRRTDSRMQRRRHHGMTPRAQIGRRLREAVVTVALGARELADVRGVAGAFAYVAIRDGHLRRGPVVSSTRAPGDRHDHNHDRPHHGDARDPIG